MSVYGAFDPGSGNPSLNNIISGTFTAASGSSVMTNSATWEVLAGGLLDVAAGATLTVASGSTLLVDGTVTVGGTLVSSSASIMLVDGNWALSTQGAGLIDIQGTLLQWGNPTETQYGTAL